MYDLCHLYTFIVFYCAMRRFVPVSTASRGACGHLRVCAQVKGAYSGGRATKEEHERLGADLEVTYAAPRVPGCVTC